MLVGTHCVTKKGKASIDIEEMTRVIKVMLILSLVLMALVSDIVEAKTPAKGKALKTPKPPPSKPSKDVGEVGEAEEGGGTSEEAEAEAVGGEEESVE